MKAKGKGFTLEDLQNSKIASLNPHIFDKVRKTPINTFRKTKSKGLDYLAKNLPFWAKENGYLCIGELLFDNKRKYRLDFAIMEGKYSGIPVKELPFEGMIFKVAVEFEGGVFNAQGGHKNAHLYTKDTDKYNLAGSQGWTILRYTAMNYTNVLNDLNKIVGNPTQPKLF